MSPGDESPEGTEIETFGKHWEGDRVVEVPSQERIIINLTGRTMVRIALKYDSTPSFHV
jgi:hypothetical protein